MNLEAVRAAIAKLGTGPYLDGSSATPGWTYQPIGDWIPELADIPCHKPEAVRDDFWAVVRDYAYHAAWDMARAIEVGAANGYYRLGLYRLGCLAVSIERDPAARAILEAMFPEDVHENPTRYGHLYDVGLMMNVHMWITRQGEDDQYMRWVAANCATVYFQTAGKHSGGMCIIPELDSEDAERRYLERYFARVHHVRDTTLHGGIRRLWRCES